MEKHYWSRLTRAMVVPVRLSFLFFLIFLVQVSFNVDLGFLGIYPQKLIHLPGIFMAPFIHGNMYHLLANLAPFLILTTTLYFFYDKVADKVFLSVYLITNCIVWIIGRPYFHIGASGIVYGLASFLICLGFFRISIKALIISSLTLFLYGSTLYGVIPTERKISWESHLAGAAVGCVVAFRMARKPRLSRFSMEKR